MNKRFHGYKGFKCNPDNGELYCQPSQLKKPFIYPEGKTVSVKGEILPCRNGIHFCSSLIEVFSFYSVRSDHFFAKVSTGGQYIVDTYNINSKNISRSIRVDEILLTSEVLKRAGYYFESGIKTIKDIRYSKRKLFFETPEVYVKFKKRMNSGKAISVDARYYNNYSNITLIHKVY